MTEKVVGDLLVTFSTPENRIAFSEASGVIKLWQKKKEVILPHVDESNGENHYLYFYFNTRNPAAAELIPFLDGEKVTEKLEKLYKKFLPEGIKVEAIWFKGETGLNMSGLIQNVVHIHKVRFYQY